MRTRLWPTLAMLAVAAPGTVFADYGDGHEFMGMDGGFGGMMAGGMMMVLFWAGLIAVLYFAVRWFARTTASGDRSGSAVEILRERYARGEIDRSEYEERRVVLESVS